MSETTTPTTQEQAEAFVTAQMADERAALQAAIDSALNLEKEVSKEYDKLDKAYHKLARRNFDAEPDEDESKARKAADISLRKLQGVSQAIASNREKLSRLDKDFTRRVRSKREQLERGRNGNNDNKGGKSMAKTETKRVPVPQNVIDRVVRDVVTKSQQEVADELNAAGIKTANGKPWTPQNIWHLVKKATGKGVPRKKTGGTPRKTTGAAKKKTASRKKTGAKKKTTAKSSSNGAKPLSKSSQASGTSRGGSGHRKKTSTSRRRVTKRNR